MDREAFGVRDGKVVDLRERDALRVAPGVTRAFEADRAVIERGVERFNAGDREAFYDLMAPDVVLTTIAAWPEQGPHVGRDAVRRFTEQFVAAWETVSLRVDELSEQGDGRFVGAAAWVARGAASGADMELPFGAVWTVRDGRVARVELHDDVEHAREAASAQ